MDFEPMPTPIGGHWAAIAREESPSEADLSAEYQQMPWWFKRWAGTSPPETMPEDIDAARTVALMTALGFVVPHPNRPLWSQLVDRLKHFIGRWA